MDIFNKAQQGGEFLDFKIPKISTKMEVPILKTVNATRQQYFVAIRRYYIARGKLWKGQKSTQRSR